MPPLCHPKNYFLDLPLLTGCSKALGEGRYRTDSTVPSILLQASDWEMQVDLKKKLAFPEEVAVTTLRP
ncbi:hypothetical protein M9458_053329, partial [Cirrhinus mrigala]